MNKPSRKFLAVNAEGAWNWLLGISLALGCFLIYWRTLCPTVFWYDSAEYATAAVTLGIPHPPGYPLYTLIGRLFVLLPFEPARAINLMSAFFSTVTIALAFAVLRQLGVSGTAAAIGAATLGLGRLFWSQSIIAEVYTPGLAFLFVVLLLLFKGLAREKLWMMILAAALAGLGLGVHLYLATCGLGFAVLVLGWGLPVQRLKDLRLLFSRQNLGRRLWVAAACLGAALLGSLIFLYVPLRAAMGPEMNFENPSTWERFLWFVTGGNYKTWFLHDYSWSGRAWQILAIFYDQLLVVGLVLAACGLIFLLWRRALVALALFFMMAGNVYFFFNYRVHDVEVFFLPTVANLCLLVGIGVHAILTGLDSLLSAERGPWIRRFVRIVLCGFPLSLLLANYRALDLSQYTAARDYGDKLSAQLPANAVILNFTRPAEWKNDAVFTHYFQKVLHKRRDVRVLSRTTPLQVLGLLHQGGQVFLYYPVPEVLALFEVKKEGEVYRVLRPRHLSERSPTQELNKAKQPASKM